MTYFEKIKERRKELKLTQKDVADFLEISQQGYALYESGKRKMDFETALKIGEKLEISLDALGLNYRSAIPKILLPSNEKTAPLSEKEAAIEKVMKLLDELPEDKVPTALDYLQYLAEKDKK